MQATDLITLILFLILWTGLTALYYFQIKKVKEKIGKVINGEIEHRQLSKFIKKAQVFGRTKFIIYMWLWQGLMHSILITISIVVVDTVFANNEPDLKKYLINFAVVFVLSSLNEVIKANSIWHSIEKHADPN